MSTEQTFQIPLSAAEAYEERFVPSIFAEWAPIILDAVDLVILAGFMRILTPVFINAYRGRLLNIHPSLLPKYRGLETHARAIAAGDTEHGCTVHEVTAALDDGPILGVGHDRSLFDGSPPRHRCVVELPEAGQGPGFGLDGVDPIEVDGVRR